MSFSLILALASSATAGIVVEHFNPWTGAGVNVTYTSATANLDALVLTDCRGNTSVYDYDVTLNLLTHTPVYLPAGTWCDVALSFDGPMYVAGSISGGGTFSVVLSPQEVDLAVSQALIVSSIGAVPVIRLGGVGWITDQNVWAPPGQHRNVVVGDPSYVGLLQNLLNYSAVVF